jgi:hypothetical protein
MDIVGNIIVAAILALVNLEIIRRFGYRVIPDLDNWESRYNGSLNRISPNQAGNLIQYLAFLPFVLQCSLIIIDKKIIILPKESDCLFLFLVALPLTYQYILANITNPLYSNRFRQGGSILSILIGWVTFIIIPEIGGLLLAAIIFLEMSKLNLLGQYSTSDKLLPIFSLICISSAFEAQRIVNILKLEIITPVNWSISVGVFLGMSISIIICYIGCGLKKIKISTKPFPLNLFDWALNDRLDLGAIAYWNRGSKILKWFGANDDILLNRIAPFLGKYGWGFGFISLIIEFPLFILFSQDVAYITLGSLFMLHLGIFLISGILFWKWMFVLVCFAGFISGQSDLFMYMSVYEITLATIALLAISYLGYGQGVKARFLPCSLGWWYGGSILVERYFVRSKEQDIYLPRVKTKPFNYLFTFSRVRFKLFPNYNFSAHQESSVKGHAKSITMEHHQAKFEEAVYDKSIAKQILYMADLYIERLTEKNSTISSMIEKIEPPAHVWVEEPSYIKLTSDSLRHNGVFFQIYIYIFKKTSEGKYSINCKKLLETKL